MPPMLSQQQVLHNQHVLMAHQYALVHGQQLSNYATGHPSIFGRSPMAPRATGDARASVLAMTIESARNAPALPRAHDLSWTLAHANRPTSSSQPAEAKGQGCISRLLESCCNVWGCRGATLD